MCRPTSCASGSGRMPQSRANEHLPGPNNVTRSSSHLIRARKQSLRPFVTPSMAAQRTSHARTGFQQAQFAPSEKRFRVTPFFLREVGQFQPVLAPCGGNNELLRTAQASRREPETPCRRFRKIANADLGPGRERLATQAKAADARCSLDDPYWRLYPDARPVWREPDRRGMGAGLSLPFLHWSRKTRTASTCLLILRLQSPTER